MHSKTDLKLIAVGVDAGAELKKDFGHSAVTGQGGVHQQRVTIHIMVLSSAVMRVLLLCASNNHSFVLAIYLPYSLFTC